MSIEAMKQALEALEDVQEAYGNHSEWFKKRVEALRAAIGQAEKQEPVANINAPINNGKYLTGYTAPPQREWVGLTTEEIADAYLTVNGDREWAIGGMGDAVHFTRAIEAKLKEKNT